MTFQKLDEQITPIQKDGGSHGFFGGHLRSHIKFVYKWSDVMARILTNLFGSVGFLIMSLVFILAWIIVNFGLISDMRPFDPYPFSLLVILLSVFAIVLSVIVLISQNRQWRNAEIRRQIEFEVNVCAEHEVTKILAMLHEIHERLGIIKIDIELEHMKEKTDISEIKKAVEKVFKEEKT